MFVGLLKFLFIAIWISGLMSWILIVSFMIAAARNRRPEVRLREDLKNNMLNALLAKKWLTDDGIKYRACLFRATLAFLSSLTAGLVVGLLLDWSGNMKNFSKPINGSYRSQELLPPRRASLAMHRVDASHTLLIGAPTPTAL